MRATALLQSQWMRRLRQRLQLRWSSSSRYGEEWAAYGGELGDRYFFAPGFAGAMLCARMGTAVDSQLSSLMADALSRVISG
jgi:hypothetical protein